MAHRPQNHPVLGHVLKQEKEKKKKKQIDTSHTQ
jgi:hypothetical protein